MKTLILAVAFAAVSFAAHADSTSTTKCARVPGGTGCISTLETPRSTTETLCGFSGAGSKCRSTTTRKEPDEADAPRGPRAIFIKPAEPDYQFVHPERVVPQRMYR